MNNKVKTVAIVTTGVIAGVALGAKIVKTIKTRKQAKENTK